MFLVRRVIYILIIIHVICICIYSVYGKLKTRIFQCNTTEKRFRSRKWEYMQCNEWINVKLFHLYKIYYTAIILSDYITDFCYGSCVFTEIFIIDGGIYFVRWTYLFTLPFQVRGGIDDHRVWVKKKIGTT